MSNPNVSYCEKGVQLCHSEGGDWGLWQCAGGCIWGGVVLGAYSKLAFSRGVLMVSLDSGVTGFSHLHCIREWVF